MRALVDGLRAEPALDIDRPEPATLESAVRGFEMLARYHRLDVRGLDRIPEGPAVLVGNHNGGLNPVDGLFLVHYYRQLGYDQPIYILAHDILFKHPRMAAVLRSVGIVPARRQTARAVLDAGHKLLVFPGGDIETLRPYRDRGKVVLAGRRGFARLSLEHDVPVVPLVSAGSHETFIVLSQGRRIAKALRLHRWARLHSLPIMLAAPWGVLAGPTCALPYLPLPAKVTVQIGHAIEAEETPCIDRLYTRVEATMQDMLDELYAERMLPIVG
ncbi:lysophospholipid acyltransferase family protein [Paraliomyxa miuraensis]|uniref:lysophospholipid acyltransferase family protein n=1 Tax=Paraliomyxa miuraensis TaxID=376150 RepID=UPI00224FB145|nr:lysophospholipid acyltransferase family protein [Paraliomyxa miuraensis]MCX4243298.1 acyltransferase family protein [Paraliomyxa miuraensis]